MHYMPHGFCLLWNPYLIGVFVLAHFLVFLAYLLVPLELIRGMKKARISIPLELRLVILDITVFILACGGGHLIGMGIIYMTPSPFL